MREIDCLGFPVGRCYMAYNVKIDIAVNHLDGGDEINMVNCQTSPILWFVAMCAGCMSSFSFKRLDRATLYTIAEAFTFYLEIGYVITSANFVVLR